MKHDLDKLGQAIGRITQRRTEMSLELTSPLLLELYEDGQYCEQAVFEPLCAEKDLYFRAAFRAAGTLQPAHEDAGRGAIWKGGRQIFGTFGWLLTGEGEVAFLRDDSRRVFVYVLDNWIAYECRGRR